MEASWTFSRRGAKTSEITDILLAMLSAHGQDLHVMIKMKEKVYQEILGLFIKTPEPSSRTADRCVL